MLLALLGGAIGYVTQPLLGVARRPPSVHVDPARLEAHVRALSVDCAPRDVRHPENLARAAAFVRAEFEARCGDVAIQPFSAGGRTYHNVAAAFGPEQGDLVLVGAHYDAAEPGIGADDNASGVAALIELAGLLARDELAAPVELVAFALEEPPYFRTKSMGSYVDAQALLDQGAHVRAMLSLEMIGCFRDEPASQDYPAPGIGLLYPSRGNFIAVVSCLGQAGLVRRVKRSMAEVMDVPVRSINAPRVLPGVDFSDQLNYWDAGFDALMITDTAFYRNPNYHRSTDLPETLDYGRMADVVAGIHAAVLALAGE